MVGLSLGKSHFNTPIGALVDISEAASQSRQTGDKRGRETGEREEKVQDVPKILVFLHNQHNILDYRPVTEALRESIYDGDKYKVFPPYYLSRNSYLNFALYLSVSFAIPFC